MISKMKLQNGILTLIGFIILVSICILVDRLESRKPEMEIRESVEGVNVYNEESKLVDLLLLELKLIFLNIIEKIWKKSDGNLQEKQIISIIQTIER